MLYHVRDCSRFTHPRVFRVIPSIHCSLSTSQILVIILLLTVFYYLFHSIVKLALISASFYFTVCKSCLVKHLEDNNTCPTCTIVIHQSHPLQYISFDRTMQDIVYKLVPNLQQSMSYFLLVNHLEMFFVNI